MAVELEPGCTKLDKALAQYYKNMGKSNEYFPNGPDEDSVFATWVDDNGFDDESLESELNDDPQEATMTTFHIDEDDDDKNLFPLNKPINDEKERNKEIHRIMKHCYVNGVAPGVNNLELQDLDLSINEKNTDLCTKSYGEQTPDIFDKIGKEKDIMDYLATKKNNNDFPVLPIMVDCYSRYRMEKKIKESNKEPPLYAEWIKKLKTIKIEENEKTKLATALAGYCNRISPTFQFSPLFAIDDTVSDIANYVAATSEFIKGLMESNESPTPPFQVDLCIAVKKVIKTGRVEAPEEMKDNEDDDDVDNPDVDTKQKQYKIGNVHEKLRHEKCEFLAKPLEHLDHLEQPRFLQEHFNDFKKHLKEKKVKGYDRKIYPHSKRFVIFVDRRDDKKQQEDEITFLNPPSVCNSIPSNHVAEWYFESARKCFIPRKGFGDGLNEQDQDEKEQKDDNKTINAQHAMGGKLISFSFHVDSAVQIKCYLFWNGQTMRFYPQDINDAFRYIFDKNRFKEFRSNQQSVNKIFKRIHVKDEQYERFYQSLSNDNKTFPRNKI